VAYEATAKDTMSTFLIIGGTGKVGSRVSKYLESAGHVARVASRTGGDIRFDWRDSASYRSAVDGVDGVFVVGPGSATDWSASLNELLASASDAGVRQVVLLSARGVEFLPDGAVARAEHALRAGPIPWTILRPSHFAQNFTEAMFVPVDGVVIAPVGAGAEPFVDVDDIAQVAATVFATDGWRNEIIDISGPDALGFDEAVKILSTYADRPLRFEDESVDDHIARLRGANTPEGYIEWRMAMLGGIRRGEDAYLSDGVQRVLGRAATSFGDWAAREASVLA
jgi:uncharacterized protein YbjT (DUF2867 family)